MANSAIALGQCDRYGYAYGYSTMGEAKAEALAQCAKEGDRTCQIIVTVHRGCGALAVSANCGSKGWAYAPTRRYAELRAIKECVGHGGVDCTIRRWVCDRGW
ncbi:MAG TPA: DUF4189 domain-containing protein [Xanthobacteraceae bacterium]|nr:DUF4189 domain-containing protein [Xanthobacteraceae bacterium]